MAEEEVKVDEKNPEGKKKKSFVLILLMIIIGLALAGGISYFVTTKIVSTSHVSAPVKRAPGIFVKIGDTKDSSIVVNVGGVKSGRFLKIGIVLEMNPADEINFKDKKITEEAQSKILDAVMTTLRSQTLEQFEAVNQPKLKDQLKKAINAAIGDGAVYDVYITSFVLQ
ncbi:flagellar basal body-associated protein FliL [Pectinatus brassicae]|uniref:Flagellar protein FliL n=1 Tax=Pectinatus brassicae TaxID=862415 RepID=A0A840UK58_9FIRM|nr:flagellar basal body-associated FliL family protein [Pectinatus brassicae]MBB5336570.1 flagellar FliL protein [Pectinatus brassicae]